MPAANITIAARTRPSPDWDGFVATQLPVQPYWYSDWALVPNEVFGHEVRFMEARDGTGSLRAVLPLARQKSLVLGDFITSLPFFNYGGALGDDVYASDLMQHARDWAAGAKCSYVEFRDIRQWPGEWGVRTDKVAMILDLPESFEELGKNLGSKLRSQVRRANRESPSLSAGGMDLLGDFYKVFALNMRDLGTPVYPRKFFVRILEKFEEVCCVLVIYRGSVPHAAALLVFNGVNAEIPWAGCSKEGKSWGFNMKLYWECLAVAMERGARRFDFGRSTRNSGTFRFKKQWGAEPMQLYWHRWERNPARNGKLMEPAASIWRRLPLPIANVFGPLVSPGLPW